MRLFSELFSFVAILFNTYILVKSFGIISNKKIIFNFLTISLIFIISLIIHLSNVFLPSHFRIIASLLCLIILCLSIYKESIFFVSFKCFIILLMLSLCDFSVSLIYVMFSYESSLILENITFIRGLSTILDSLLLLLFFLIPSFVNYFNKLLKYINVKRNYIYLTLSALSCIVFLILTRINVVKLNVKIFIVSTLLMSFFLILCIIMIFQYFKNKHSEEEQKALLDLMKEYETILENDKINRHEMLNNLIVLKSYKDKSSLEYEEMIDEIIDTYQDHKSKIYSNLYKLPSGFKGIIYYKMLKIKENNIEVTLLSSPEIEESLNNINKKLYFKVCKILGIILDNAIEAASLTDDKHLLIDIYLDEDLEIYVENSFIKSIDLNNINSKGYSTKGKNRGYGLYIVNKLVKENNSLELIQNVEGDKFISILKIKNPSNN